LAGLVERLTARARWPEILVAVGPALICLAIAARHRAWQEPQAQSLAAARLAVQHAGSHELGLSGGAFKVGMLFPGRVAAVAGPTPDAPPVVLCGAESASHRVPGATFHCAISGYDDHPLAGGFHVLMRRPGL
jgi:hypothetical protein